MITSTGFLGVLGEPLHQLRELIKDIWFRNRQERIAGELDLLERRIQIAHTFGLNGGEGIQRLAESFVAYGDTKANRQIHPAVGAGSSAAE
ncbi:MAG TPA: hypothetical protein VGY30_09970 [Solirubrobacteraceae bacterium]|jgi:hypothetical protein|nr:hypothetical protein [Solirubrobacteraceae bacterium]